MVTLALQLIIEIQQPEVQGSACESLYIREKRRF